jgi:hypothetical protein
MKTSSNCVAGKAFNQDLLTSAHAEFFLEREQTFHWLPCLNQKVIRENAGN